MSRKCRRPAALPPPLLLPTLSFSCLGCTGLLVNPKWMPQSRPRWVRRRGSWLGGWDRCSRLTPAQIWASAVRASSGGKYLAPTQPRRFGTRRTGAEGTTRSAWTPRGRTSHPRDSAACLVHPQQGRSASKTHLAPAGLSASLVRPWQDRRASRAHLAAVGLCLSAVSLVHPWQGRSASKTGLTPERTFGHSWRCCSLVLSGRSTLM